MKIKPIALGVGIAALALRFYVGDFDQADAKLDTFYAEILSANFAGARASIDEAIKLWPSNARYYSWRGYVEGQNLPPRCPHALDPQALKTEDQSATRLAMEDYRKALELNSRDAVARHNLAWLEHLEGDDKAASQDWAAAVSIDPGNAVFHLSYGMFLEEAGDREKARIEYATAIDLTPSILDSRFFADYRGRSEHADSIVRGLIARLEAKLRESPDSILQARLGKLYEVHGDLSLASKVLEDASRQLPNLPLVWMNLGDIFRKQGRLDEAMDCYRKARVINGSLAGPYLRIGQVELVRGQSGAAADDLKQAIHRWQRVTPITAAHNNRLYVGPRQRIDDLLPTTLVWYIMPCEASEAYRGLAELFPGKREFEVRAYTCEQLPSPHFSGNAAGQ